MPALTNAGHVNGHDIIEALDAAGYKIMPKEPTEEMYLAAEMHVGILQIYEAMIAAAPTKEAANPKADGS